MCGRFALDTTRVEIKTQFHVDHIPELSSLFNIAPTQNALVLMQSPIDEMRHTEWFTWGLIPYFAKDKKMNPPLINARAETLATKPAFRTSFKSKRGIVIMSGYFEWQQLEHYKQPYYIRRKNKKLLAVAALWDTWQSQRGEVVHSCCLITTQANSLVARFHDRMPVVLNEEQQQIWLDARENNIKTLEDVLVPKVSDEMIIYPVTPKMNNWRYIDADAINPINL
ncbi:SOS response-associated peptidase [Legionella pneumophila]|uniref:SOS response-associated peptidase n=2 Tax=Legionella pneumophila TaxID=446 RepID=UPI00077A02C8|nr:SOS response-associated peptidase [Legionella pneumophila]HCU6008005.1 SOS response-associated peptidase [Legionella pneumophila]